MSAAVADHPDRTLAIRDAGSLVDVAGVSIPTGPLQILFKNPTTDPPANTLPSLAEAQGTIKVTITSSDGVYIA